MAEPNPFALLTEDHQLVAQLFEDISQSSTDAGRQEAFDMLHAALEQHAHIEEQYLYPILEKTESTQATAQEAEAEHAAVRTLLEQVATLDPSDDTWMQTVRTIREAVERHVHEEETILFPHATHVMTQAQQQRLAEEIVSSRGE